jgi:hypothetical protein
VIAAPPRIPVADLRGFLRRRRRTAVERAVAAALVLGVAAAAVVVASHGRSDAPPLLSPSSDALVVLDVSASISPDTYARIDATLSQVARSQAHLGLILFSDTAYLALPPGTPARELKPFARAYRVPHDAGGSLATAPRNPWTDTFSAGTKISLGLQLALDTIRERKLGAPEVLLVSDLDDDTTDRERLTGIALAFRSLGIPVRVVGLNPSADDERTVAGLLRNRGHLSLARLPGQNGPAAPFPSMLVALAVLLAAALALYELGEARLKWGRST